MLQCSCCFNQVGVSGSSRCIEESAVCANWRGVHSEAQGTRVLAQNLSDQNVTPNLYLATALRDGHMAKICPPKNSCTWMNGSRSEAIVAAVALITARPNSWNSRGFPSWPAMRVWTWIQALWKSRVATTCSQHSLGLWKRCEYSVYRYSGAWIWYRMRIESAGH